MTHHVFAVWDFMSLAKSLQRRLTCVDVPWLPAADPVAARLINEIVLGEETDEVGDGEYSSHYALYLRAMGEIGADPGPMERFERGLRDGLAPADALAPVAVCDAVKTFVLNTLSTAERPVHEVAASLLLAREDLIPVMFDRVLREMDRSSGFSDRALRSVRGRLPDKARAAVPGRLRTWARDVDQRRPDPRANFRLYLRRHVHLDGEEHGPMGRRMLLSLCGQDEARWEQATAAARDALQARIALWDGVLVEIERADQASRIS